LIKGLHRIECGLAPPVLVEIHRRWWISTMARLKIRTNALTATRLSTAELV